MLHGAHCGADIAYAAPAVGAEAFLELGHYGAEQGVDVACGGAVLRGESYGQGVAGYGVLYAAVVGFADAYDIGADGMVYGPGGVFAAVVIDGAALQYAAALGAPACFGLHLYRVGGLVVVVVAAGEYGMPYGVQRFAEGGAEVVGHVVVEVESAEAIALYISEALVGDVHGERVAHGDAVEWYASYCVAHRADAVDEE